jgi:hypothetical protein
MRDGGMMGPEMIGGGWGTWGRAASATPVSGWPISELAAADDKQHDVKSTVLDGAAFTDQIEASVGANIR